jgi:hypothetical protein
VDEIDGHQKYNKAVQRLLNSKVYYIILLCFSDKYGGYEEKGNKN